MGVKVQGERSLVRVGTSSWDRHLLSSLHMQEEEEEEELRMLASLRREQEEEEEEEEMGGAIGLTSSQIHQCNVSISTSSDDTSTWTLIPAVRPICILHTLTVVIDFTQLHS